jgi:hypothetical protein
MEEAEFRDRVIRLLESINLKLESLEGASKTSMRLPSQSPRENKTPLDVDVLLSLPDHLRQTAMAVSAKGSATAEEVASDTGRTRAAESDYLNQLVKMGHLSKRRKGRTVYFHV